MSVAEAKGRRAGLSRDSDDGAPRHAVSREPVGGYLTDGSSLFFVVDTFSGASTDAMVGLEDCRSLDIVLVPGDKLADLGLRPVRPARPTRTAATR